MGNAFILTLGLSLAGGATCLVVLASGTLVRKKLRSSWLYYLWLIVLLCFVIPVPLNLPFASGGLKDISAALSAAMTVREQPSDSPAADGSTPSGSSEAAAGYEKTTVPETGDGLPAADPSDGTVKDSADRIGAVTAHLLRLLPCVWLAGASAMLLWTLHAYTLMLYWLRRNRTLKTTGRVPVYESTGVTTPLLVGILRPAVYLPAGFDNAGLAIRHELCHLRRGDLWLKWLLQLIVCVHWFNPLAYRMRRELNRLCELACDISAVRELGEADRRTYGAMLLDTAGAAADRGFMLVVALGRDKQILKERLREIMKTKSTSRKAVAAMSVLTVIVLTAAVSFGALFSGCANQPATSGADDITASDSSADVSMVITFNAPSASPSAKVLTVTTLYTTRIVDLPFDSDADVRGTWLPVGKFDSVSSFAPPYSRAASTWELAIAKDGLGWYAFYTQHEGFQEVTGYPRWASAVSYDIRELDGKTYLFIEEKGSGDLISYFVFEKLSDTVPTHNGTPPGNGDRILIITDMS